MGQLYQNGSSIHEIATSIGKSYSYARNSIIESGVALRTKSEGTRVYVSRHPEWSAQFMKYRVEDSEKLTEQKVLLLAMVATEGYTNETSFGFTNKQDLMHKEFGKLVQETYGEVVMGRNKMTSRVSSMEIARDLSRLLPEKAFGDEALRFVLDSPATAQKVLRVIANAEGALLISIRRAARNFTVESRVVLASSNPHFTRQIAMLLDSIGIENHMSSIGVRINKKTQIARFIQLVGFSPGVKVVRTRAGLSSWYGCEKTGLSRLFFKIDLEQKRARALGLRGCFADCSTRTQTIRRLRGWYAEVHGGETA